MQTPKQPLRLAVLISGGGRSLLNLQRRIEEGRVNARIEIVVSSRDCAPGVGRARDAGLRVVVVERAKLSAEEFQAAITRAVQGADLVVMAGFLSLWKIPPEFGGKVINIHPALLPQFGGRGMYGAKVHEAVLRSGQSVSGCTVHFCDDEYDHGSIILQKQVPILPGDTADTLAARVFEQECEALPEAIQRIVEGKVR